MEYRTHAKRNRRLQFLKAGLLLVLLLIAGVFTASAVTDTLTATHNSGGYVADSNLTVTMQIEYSTSTPLSAFGVEVTLPAGWTYVAVGGTNVPPFTPQVGATGKLEFGWIQPPASPVSFTYTAKVPAGASGPKDITATVLYRIGAGGEQLATATPNPLQVQDDSPKVAGVEVQLADGGKPSFFKAGNVDVIVTFSKTMSGSELPNVAFGRDGSGTYARAISGSYINAERTTWKGTYEIQPGYDGTQRIQIKDAKDTNGNKIATDTSKTFAVDTTLPTGTITAPDNTETIHINDKNRNVVGTAADPLGTGADVASGVDKVYFKLNEGGAWQELTPVSGAWTQNLNSLITNAGTYIIFVKVKDKAGNESAAIQGATLVYDTTKPTVTAVNFVPVSPFGVGNVQITIDFSEDMDTATAPAVTFDLQGGSSPKTVTGAYVQGNARQWQGTFTMATDYDGTQILNISAAKDKAGNVMDASTAFNFVLDTIAPVLTVTTPSADAHVTSSQQNFNGTVTDATSGVKEVKVSIDNGANWANANLQGQNWNFAANLVQGANVVLVRAWDNANNAATSAPKTLTYNPGLVIKVDGQDMNGKIIYVPNVAGNNTKIITIEGGTGAFGGYTWTLTWTTGNAGALSAGASADKRVFTATVGQTGTATLTLVDPASPGVYTATATIEVVDFGITTGRVIIEKGKQETYEVAGAVGNVNWQIVEGDDVAGAITVSGDKNKTAKVTPSKTGQFKIRATDGTTSAQSEKTVEVVDPIIVTPAKTALIDTDTVQFNAVGGKGAVNTDYTWTVTEVSGGPNVGAISNSGLFTPDASKAGVRTIKGKATDKNANAGHIFGESAVVTIVDPLVINPNTAQRVQSGGSVQFAYVSGGSGAVNWTATAGVIDGTGKFTAPTVTTQTDVTITATDAQFGNITTTVVVTVYKTVAVTNPPATPPIIKPGEASVKFSAAGGSGTYTWSVTGPVAVADRDGADYTFVAPNTGNFAGKYTVTVKDKNNPTFTSTFDVYVPVQVVVWDNIANAPAKPILYTDSGASPLKVLGVAAGTDLAITKTENAVAGAVFADIPSPTATNPFNVTPQNEGSAIITVKPMDAGQPVEQLAGSVRVDVLGRCTELKVTVGNIPADIGNKNNILVQLFDQQDGLEIDAPGKTIDVNNQCTFTNANAGLPYRAYQVRVSVNNDNVYKSGQRTQRVLVNTTTATTSINLPALSKDTLGVTINLGGAYAAGQQVKYTLYLAESPNIVLEGTATATPINLDLEKKNYRLMITDPTGNNYQPWEYADATPPTKFLKLTGQTAPQVVNATLVAMPKSAFITSQETRSATVDLTIQVVVTSNVAAYSYTMTPTPGMGTGTTTPVGGTGTAGNPYTYTWKSAGDGALDVANNVKNYEMTFDAKESGATIGSRKIGFIEPVTNNQQSIIDSQSGSNNTNTQSKGQDMKELAGDNSTLFVVLDERDFFASVGTNFEVTLKDVNGVDRNVTIVIPPLPTDLLFIDDYDTAKPNDNLLYGGLKPGGTDLFGQTRTAATTVTAADILRAKVQYVTMGGNAYANGVSISFERRNADGTGTPVRYNPILEGTRNQFAPKIAIPLLLNPNSATFKSLKRLSEAKGLLRTLVSEIGDGVAGFKAEALEFVVQDDGLVWMDVYHLSSFGFGGIFGGGGDSSSSSSSCFIATAAYGSYLDGHVEILRNFRDAYLMTNDAGRAFVEFYYRHSPPLADFIARHDILRAAVRVGLAPMVGMSYVALYTTTVQKIMIVLVMSGMLMAIGLTVRRYGRRSVKS